MENIIKLKRGNKGSAGANLQQYEIGFATDTNQVIVGLGNNNIVCMNNEIYIGSTPPTDPEVKLWVDTSIGSYYGTSLPAAGNTGRIFFVKAT